MKKIDRSWPPTRKVGYSPIALMKRLDAWLRQGSLVWLRDFDGECALSVAYHSQSSGFYISHRVWPYEGRVVLKEDGNVDTDNLFVVQWIAADDTNKVFMYMKNTETYLQPLPELDAILAREKSV